MLMLTGGGNYCLAQETAYKTLSFPDDNNNNNKISAYDKSWTAKIGDFSWRISRFNNNNWNNDWTYIKAGNKTVASQASIQNTTPFDRAIAKVVVDIEPINKQIEKVEKIKFEVASDANFQNIVEEKTIVSDFNNVENHTFVVKNPKVGQYFRLTFNLGKTANKLNGLITVNKVEYYEDASNKTATSLSFDAPSYEIPKDQTLTKLPTLKAGEQTLSDKTITWSSDNTEVATVDKNGTVTGVGLGKANITATFAGDNEYRTSTAKYEIKVKGAPALSFPEKSYNIFANDKFTAPELTKSPADVVVTYSSSDEKVATVDAQTGEVSIVGAGTTKITATSVVTDVYEVASASYDLVVTKFTPKLTFPQTSYTIEMGDAFAPKLEGLPKDVTPEYTSSNTEVATVDAATGEVKIVGVGTTTITVTSPETDIYEGATASYVLTVKPAVSKVVTIDFSKLPYTSNTSVDELTDWKNEGITMTFNGNGGSYSPKWFKSDKTVRLYQHNTFKILSDNRIKKIEFQYGSTAAKADNPKYSCGSYDNIKKTLDLSTVNTKEVTLTFTSAVHYKKIIVTTDVSVGTITIATPEGFGTYYNSNSYILPEGLTAFGYTTANTDGTLVKTDVFNGGDVVPANAALVVKGNEGKYECYATDQVAMKTLEGNLLKGVTTDTRIEAISGVKRYILTRADDGILAFYRTNTGNINVKANRAYLEVPTAMAVASFSLEGTATGINNVVTTAAKQGIYTISGVRLNATTTKELPAGIYIVDGKKVIVK